MNAGFHNTNGTFKIKQDKVATAEGMREVSKKKKKTQPLNIKTPEVSFYSPGTAG